MNRRQVLIGAGATTIAFRGFVPWASAAPLGGMGSPALNLELLGQGIRGSFSINGQITQLVGTILPAVSRVAADAASALTAPQSIVSGPISGVPAPVTTAAEPMRAPMMSIVRVPREGANQTVRATH